MKQTVTIDKGNGESVCVSPREYKGKKYIDIRIWYSSKEGDRLLPTKKGVVLTEEQFEDMIKKIVEED